MVQVDGLRLPDFIIGGAPRSATTWLVEVLERHPDLALAQPIRPEPKFFLVDSLYDQGLQHYSRTWFEPLPEGRVLGEKSTNYLEHPVVAERIATALPQARLVFLLRDPVERAWSNWRWSTANGMEDLDFEKALEQEDARERTLPADLRYARPHAYFSRGLYARLLRPWLQQLGAERVLCLAQETLLRDPQELARLHRFLGVPERPHDADGIGVVNAAPGQEMRPSDEVREHLRHRYAGPNRELAELLGTDDFSEWGDGT